MLVQNMIPLDEPELALEEIEATLQATPIPQRNRILADLVSFLQLCVERWSSTGIEAQCRALGYDDFEAFVDSLPDTLAEGIRAELELSDPQSVEEMWLTWLKTVETDKYPSYMPPHFFYLLLEDSDWTDEFFSISAHLVALSRLCYRSVI